jgi:Zn-dependent peptidase ImmA (M78 family)/DNA-binding XRE family transcriptional regulator
MSLDALAEQMGGIVSKQAISKYEQGKAKPSGEVLSALAKALSVTIDQLDRRAAVDVRFIAYRKKSALTKRDRLRIESTTREQLETRVELADMTGTPAPSIPVQQLAIRRVEDAERMAAKLRDTWAVGSEQPVASVVHLLESHRIHVLQIDAKPAFDGLSAIAYRDNNRIAATAAISRTGIVGERQRLNLTHELGHQVLKIPKSVDEEASAFRFASAFLAPMESLINDVGPRRTRIRAEELLLLKEKYGLSLQAILMRLKTLEVISESHFREWFRELGRLGWRKEEPNALPTEEPQWLRRTVLRAVAEKLIDEQEAKERYGVEIA